MTETRGNRHVYCYKLAHEQRRSGVSGCEQPKGARHRAPGNKLGNDDLGRLLSNFGGNERHPSLHIRRTCGPFSSSRSFQVVSRAVGVAFTQKAAAQPSFLCCHWRCTSSSSSLHAPAPFRCRIAAPLCQAVASVAGTDRNIGAKSSAQMADGRVGSLRIWMRQVLRNDLRLLSLIA